MRRRVLALGFSAAGAAPWRPPRRPPAPVDLPGPCCRRALVFTTLWACAALQSPAETRRGCSAAVRWGRRARGGLEPAVEAPRRAAAAFARFAAMGTSLIQRRMAGGSAACRPPESQPALWWPCGGPVVALWSFGGPAALRPCGLGCCANALAWRHVRHVAQQQGATEPAARQSHARCWAAGAGLRQATGPSLLAPPRPAVRRLTPSPGAGGSSAGARAPGKAFRAGSRPWSGSAAVRPVGRG